MTNSEVVVGCEYYTKVSRMLVRVIVISKVKLKSGHTRFVVKRVGKLSPLPRPRTAAALIPTEK